MQLEDFAQRLAARRKALGLNQTQAAKACGATLRNWQRWEAGETLPHLRQLPAIAAGLETTPAELLGAGDSEARPPRSAHELAVDTRLHRIERQLERLLGDAPELLRQADELAARELDEPDSRRAAS